MALLDSLILELDKALRTVFASTSASRGVPGAQCQAPSLSEGERAHAGALMRVNHVGEVCAQALYQGQSLSCQDQNVREALREAACEEADHLVWTEQRIRELGGRKSVLNPFWYVGALSLGFVAGKFGDQWSLGFLAETERQVCAHLARHLSEFPIQDKQSRAIILQMKIDEAGHAKTAAGLGARDLPQGVRVAMRLAGKAMTRTAYLL